MILMQTIEDVITRLDQIIAWAEAKQSSMGYFASLYRRMTIAVRDGIAQNQFEDATRMTKLDIIFAKRYFEAFDNYQTNKPTSKAWKIAFDATKNNNITVIQHLLLGINAHINLDLGIAASETSPKNEILKLEKDFNQINTIISGLINETQDKLAEVSMTFKVLDDLLKTNDEGFVNFSIKVARTFSWENAKMFANLEGIKKQNHLISIDQQVEKLGSQIINPGFLMRNTLWLIRQTELPSVVEKIRLLG
jgi:hypothetical protein